MHMKYPPARPSSALPSTAHIHTATPAHNSHSASVSPTRSSSDCTCPSTCNAATAPTHPPFHCLLLPIHPPASPPPPLLHPPSLCKSPSPSSPPPAHPIMSRSARCPRPHLRRDDDDGSELDGVGPSHPGEAHASWWRRGGQSQPQSGYLTLIPLSGGGGHVEGNQSGYLTSNPAVR